MRLLLCLLLTFSAAACIDAADIVAPPDRAPGFTAPGAIGGSRLRPQVVESLDGAARRFLQMIDVRTDEACWLPQYIGTDTPITCRPKASGMIVHLDANCTTPYLETQYGDHTSVSGYRPGARLDPQPAERYIEFSPGNCSSMPMRASAPIYEIAEKLDPAELAAGRIVDDESDARVLVRNFEGDDGSRVLFEIIDRVAVTQCLPRMTDEGPRCAPDISTEYHDEGLLDEECERLAVLGYGGTRVATVAERGGDVYRFEVSGGFGEITIGRRTGDGRCEVETRHAGKNTLLVGVPYPSREWAPITMHDTGDIAVSARVATLPSGERAEPEPSVDVARMFESGGVPCGPVWMDSTLRCLPAPDEGVSWWATYADARCTERLIALREDAAPPQEITLYDGLSGRTGGHLSTGGVYVVGEQHSDALTFFAGSSGTCEPQTSSGTTRYYKVGARVPAARFPPLRLVTE